PLAEAMEIAAGRGEIHPHALGSERLDRRTRLTAHDGDVVAPRAELARDLPAEEAAAARHECMHARAFSPIQCMVRRMYTQICQGSTRSPPIGAGSTHQRRSARATAPGPGVGGAACTPTSCCSGSRTRPIP